MNTPSFSEHVCFRCKSCIRAYRLKASYAREYESRQAFRGAMANINRILISKGVRAQSDDEEILGNNKDGAIVTQKVDEATMVDNQYCKVVACNCGGTETILRTGVEADQPNYPDFSFDTEFVCLAIVHSILSSSDEKVPNGRDGVPGE